jgi:hypothetical protein
VGSASTTKPKVAKARSVCKPEETDVHHLLTFRVINFPYDCAVLLYICERDALYVAHPSLEVSEIWAEIKPQGPSLHTDAYVRYISVNYYRISYTVLILFSECRLGQFLIPRDAKTTAG